MKIERLETEFSVCQIKDPWDETYCFVEKTDEEISLVCGVDAVPEDTVKREDGWKAFRIQGALDFSLTGILAKISDLMAENEIGIFAVSTYNTDYILVKKEKYDRAMEILHADGYHIVE